MNSTDPSSLGGRKTCSFQARHFCAYVHHAGIFLLLMFGFVVEIKKKNHILSFGPCAADVNWSHVLSVAMVHILTPPMLLQHPGMGSKF